MAEGRSEPSMDEILSSIKRIIADDDRIRPAPKRAPKAALVEEEDAILELTANCKGFPARRKTSCHHLLFS